MSETTNIILSLGERSYPIIIGCGLQEFTAKFIATEKSPTSVTILTHPGLRSLYAEPLLRQFQGHSIQSSIVTVPAGERSKNLTTVSRIHRQLATNRVDRKGLIVTVGGGVLGDIGGFVAATYMRGIRFLQYPTTLLAQVDASIGGKTGVDLPEGKNLVGAFYQPVAVIVDINTLQTLPIRELRSGLSEVIKYGIISDNILFDRTQKSISSILNRDRTALSDVISSSCRIKADVVSRDECENGLRAILNFGHTVGHAIEAVTNYRRFKHGEAIAIGMVSAALIGNKVGITSDSTVSEIVKALQMAKLPTAFPAELSPDEVINATQSDKKRIGSRLNWVLASSIGTVVLRNDIDITLVRDVLNRHAEMDDPFPVQ